ncbi:MAG: S-layer homology domain-containing protein, partial [Oscillospiraceae bacterium]
MNKRLISLLLVFVMTVSLAAPAMAADNSEVLDVLAALGVMNGDENGDLNLSGNITRAQFAKMVVAASKYGDKGGESTGVSPFADVKFTYWAAGYVATARDAGWLNGYLDGTFRPDRSVTMAEAVTVLEKLLGYSDSDISGTWPAGQMALARSLGLNSGVNAADDEDLTRMECAKLVYNTLNADTKQGTVYALSLGYSLDTGGNIDYLSLMNKAMEGPLVVTDGTWLDEIGFTPLHVYRNSADATIADVQQYDLVYYSQKMSAVWAWNNPKTGMVDSVLPDTANPTSIVLSGVSYTLGTSAAVSAVSDLGDIQVGDVVTVLLGKDDDVAAVFSAQKLDTTVVGVVAGTGIEAYESATGDRYTKNYIAVIATDGTARKFSLDAASGADKGDIVSISYSGDTVTVKKLLGGGVSGRVNSSGTQIGTVRFSDDVEILDVFEFSAKKITTSRIAGVTIDADEVLACVKNSAGEIEKLVLDDVTGDVQSYGILTEKSTVPGTNLGFTVYYSFICNGVSTIYPSTNRDIGGEIGGVRIEGSVSAPTGMQSLKSGGISDLGTSSVTVSGNQFDTASVQVYEKRSGDYYLTTLSSVNTSDYNLTGWYDS